MVRNILNSIVIHIILALFIYINAKDIYYYETINAPLETVSIKIVKSQKEYRDLGVTTDNDKNYLNPSYRENTKLVSDVNKIKKENFQAKKEAYKKINPKLKKEAISEGRVENKTSDEKVKKSIPTQKTQKEDMSRAKIIKEEEQSIGKDSKNQTEEKKAVETKKDLIADKEEVSKEDTIEDTKEKEMYSDLETDINEYLSSYEGDAEIPVDVENTEEYDSYLEQEVERQLIESKNRQIDSKNNSYNQKDYTNSRKNMMKLSIRERATIQDQIQACYRRAILKNKKDSDTIITLMVNINRNGYIDINNVEILNDETKTKEEEQFDIAVENAKLALKLCNPLRNIPQTKYRIWREMSLEFDSSKF